MSSCGIWDGMETTLGRYTFHRTYFLYLINFFCKLGTSLDRITLAVYRRVRLTADWLSATRPIRIGLSLCDCVTVDRLGQRGEGHRLTGEEVDWKGKEVEREGLKEGDERMGRGSR